MCDSKCTDMHVGLQKIYSKRAKKEISLNGDGLVGSPGIVRTLSGLYPPEINLPSVFNFATTA